MRLFSVLSIAACAFTVLAGAANADVITSANVDGLHTFEDTNTGRVWLDLNNFFNQDPDTMIAEAKAAGFTFANTADVHQLLDSLPLTGGQWDAYAAIMGSAPNRGLIWGVYNDGGDPYGYAFAFSPERLSWSFFDNVARGNFVQNGGTEIADMDIWAFQNASIQTGVPEPVTLSLFGAGVAGAFAMRRRSKF